MRPSMLPLLAVLAALAVSSCGEGSTTPSTAVASVHVVGVPATMLQGRSVQATAEPRDAQGAALPNRAVTWTTSNASVLSISPATGFTGPAVQLLAVGPGTAVVTVVSEGKQASVSVAVSAPRVQSVTVTPASRTITAGDTLQLTAVVDRDVEAPAGVMWSSSDTRIATVDSSGRVVGREGGLARITATARGDQTKFASTIVEVRPRPRVTSITVSPSALELRSETTFNVDVNVVAEWGADGAVVWTTSNPAVATAVQVFPALARVTAVGGGTATLTATSVVSPSVSASLVVTVRVPQVTQVTVSSTAVSLFPTETHEVRATVVGEAFFNPAVSWTSSDPAVATVTSAPPGSPARVTAVAPGTATIRATPVVTPSVSASFPVTVRTVRVTDIRLSTTTLSTFVGRTTELTVQALGETGDQGQFGLGTPTSSDTSVATVTRDGTRVIVRGVGAGTARLIFPTINPNVGATATVTVLPVPLVRRIVIRDSVVTLGLGDVRILFAFVDGDLGADTRIRGVRSSNPTVATVVNAGTTFREFEIIGRSPGTATIFIETSNPEVVGTVQVTVLAPRVRAILVDSSSVTATLPASGGAAIVTVGYRVTGDPGAPRGITVMSSNADVATVVYGNGVVTITAKTPGTATITLTSEFDPSVTARIEVTVTRAAP